jgi:hypothetical protein
MSNAIKTTAPAMPPPITAPRGMYSLGSACCDLDFGDGLESEATTVAVVAVVVVDVAVGSSVVVVVVGGFVVVVVLVVIGDVVTIIVDGIVAIPVVVVVVGGGGGGGIVVDDPDAAVSLTLQTPTHSQCGVCAGDGHRIQLVSPAT